MLLDNFTVGVFSISLCCRYYQQKITQLRRSGLAYYHAFSLLPMDTNIVEANKSSWAKWQQQQLPKVLNSSINIAAPCQINMCKKYFLWIPVLETPKSVRQDIAYLFSRNSLLVTLGFLGCQSICSQEYIILYHLTVGFLRISFSHQCFKKIARITLPR